MYTVIRIKLNERAVVFKHGLPGRAPRPGSPCAVGRSPDRAALDDRQSRLSGAARGARDPADRVVQGGHAGTYRERGILYRGQLQAKVFLRPGTQPVLGR